MVPSLWLCLAFLLGWHTACYEAKSKQSLKMDMDDEMKQWKDFIIETIWSAVTGEKPEISLFYSPLKPVAVAQYGECRFPNQPQKSNANTWRDPRVKLSLDFHPFYKNWAFAFSSLPPFHFSDVCFSGSQCCYCTSSTRAASHPQLTVPAHVKR